ncbi:unnamed protein product [Sphagnum troendelagicum]|jgi:mitotic spindle assembly checkpoint protein MAD2B|uniref:HORMA domain-containing protein n=2 Tax=Sphagnum TaxID=13804 RepID=A0ABP0UBX1_9BRYO
MDCDNNNRPGVEHGHVADLVCEFLEVAVHLLLCVREIYPPELFERRRYLNLPVQWARHPELRDYIHSAVTNLKIWIQQGVVEKVAVIFVDNSNQTTALEKFIFDFSLKQLIRSSLQPNEMEFALRGFLLKLSVCEPLLRPLPPDCSWELIAYVTNLSRDTIKKEQFWIPSEHKGWQQPFTITPIKSMQSELLDMQLYVEHPGG